ncbi:MAG: hypothetical protein PHR78_06810 [Eubacteriales bacterium]|nr:hypothetical protein [Eubacteriales bacterium]
MAQNIEAGTSFIPNQDEIVLTWGDAADYELYMNPPPPTTQPTTAAPTTSTTTTAAPTTAAPTTAVPTTSE